MISAQPAGRLTRSLKIVESRLTNDVQEEARKIYGSIRKDIESVLLSKTKQDDYIEEVLSSHTRLSPAMKDTIVKERELNQKLKSKEEELKQLKKNHLIQRTQLWQEKPVRKKDIKLLNQLFPTSARPTETPEADTESGGFDQMPLSYRAAEAAKERCKQQAREGKDAFDAMHDVFPKIE